jgi:hypothetical protein
MNTYDKIRVLWIDDREEMDGFPEEQITPSEYQSWFEIVRRGNHDGLSFRSVNEIIPVVKDFWFEKDTSILPVEIIATDYNLTKIGGAASGNQTTKEQDDDIKNHDSDEDQSHKQMQDSLPITSSTSDINFEGLLIALFYGTLTYRHPAAIVPMTRYNELLPQVETLHALVEPFLGVDFQYIGLQDRQWANILKEGVKHLRKRIEKLYESGEITLSPSDLMALAEDADHGVLNMRSRHAVQQLTIHRRLPIQGLFIDIPEKQRASAIHKWAEELMKVMVKGEELKQAQELADDVWKAYKDDQLVEDRKNLSLLAAQKKAGKEIDEVAYEKLCVDFGVKKNMITSQRVSISFSGNYTDRVRRWATLLITLNMLKELVPQIKDLKGSKISNIDETDLNNFPITKDDLMLALFPSPKSPLILPWHSGENINKEHAWVKAMLSWKDDQENLGLHVSDLLAGKNWKPKVAYGLTEAERIVLRGFALEDEDKDWKVCTQAKNILGISAGGDA